MALLVKSSYTMNAVFAVTMTAAKIIATYSDLVTLIFTFIRWIVYHRPHVNS